MLDEHPSKCSRIQSKEIDHDLRSRKQICEFSINKQDEIRRVYLKKGPYQPKYIDYPYNGDNHRCKKSTPHVKNLGYAPDADGYDLVVIDAMLKANYASLICHSCRPNCEAK